MIISISPYQLYTLKGKLKDTSGVEHGPLRDVEIVENLL